QGRGGWTWYTGAAGWMYRAGVEGILGIERTGKYLEIAPCIPDDWSNFEVTVNLADTRYAIEVRIENDGSGSAVTTARLNDKEIVVSNGRVRVELDGGAHNLTVILQRGSPVKK